MNIKLKLNFFSNNILKFNLEPRTLKSDCYDLCNCFVSSNCYVSSELLRFM